MTRRARSRRAPHEEHTLSLGDALALMREAHAPQADTNKTVFQWVAGIGGALVTAAILFITSSVIGIQQDVAVLQNSLSQSAAERAEMRTLLKEPRFTQRDFDRQLAPILEKLDRLSSEIRASREALKR